MGQESYTLEDCIEIAIQNNYDLKNQTSQIQISDKVYRQSLLEKYPSLSSDFSQGFNLGRSIDPFSNQYVTKPINSANLGLSSVVTLYDGKVNKNTTRLNKSIRAISELESENIKLQLKKDVTLAYLELVLKQEILKLRKQQKQIVQLQVDRNAQMAKFGQEARGIAVDLEAQIQNENYNITLAESELEMARIRLLALMNLRNDTELTLEEPVVSDALKSSIDSRRGENILKISYLRQKELEIQQANLKLQIREGAKKPSLFFNGGLFSNYSSQANTKIKLLDDESIQFLEESQTEFIQFNGQAFPLNRIVTQPNIEEVKFGYFSQLFSNYGLSFSLNFQYPLYDKQVRNTDIQVAKIEKMMAQNDFNKMQSQIRNELTEIKTWIYTSEDKYLQALKQEEAQ